MTFLGWDRPMLHSAADWLLNPAHVSGTPDLSRLVIVVRGRRASRRLLEFLALKCAERGAILVPPEILTPRPLVLRMTRRLPGERAQASVLATALAWARAIQMAPDGERDTLFRRPDTSDAPGLRALLGLGKHLAQVWAEIGGAGLSFAEIVRVLGERFPNIADFEVPRWEAIESLHHRMRQILADHDLIDETDLLIQRALGAEIIPGRDVVLVGVAEMPRIVLDFVTRLPSPATSLVFAPENERDGFETTGVIRPAYWENRPANLETARIHLVERDRDQAARTAHLAASWRESGIEPTQITVALPEREALPRLREALHSRGLPTHSAQGRPVADAPAFQLLRLVADYLDHAPGEPPRFDAVAALARHPDVARIDPADWSALDQFAVTHFPSLFDPHSVEGVAESVMKIEDVLRRAVDIPADETTPLRIGEWTLDFLVRTYGDRTENGLSPHGRVAVQGLTMLRDVLSATARGEMAWPAGVRPADFLHVLISFLGEEAVPEPPAPDAIEIVGWLELLEDDAPATIVSSFFEGSVPASVSADPFLPGSLRQALGLGDNALRMARDAYALAAITASRSAGRGNLALLAPRFNATGDPARPSRLLLNGLEGKTLARRVWHLARKREAEPPPNLREGPGFGEVAPRERPPLRRLRATAFRDYIESPRKFFFRHVLGLDSETDDAMELEGRDVGTLIHHVLAAFGADAGMRDAIDEPTIARWLAQRFDELVRARFGPWVQPAVEIQIAEVRRRLLGFAGVQSALRTEGWAIRYVESAARLECELAGLDPSEKLTLTGKVDRIDSDALGRRWRIIDYKTSAKSIDPLRAHYLPRSDRWTDLQLPLYLKLAAPYAHAEWNVELTPENCELVYFQLPDDAAGAEISDPFPVDMVHRATEKTAEIVSKILRGDFAENPALNPDPAWNDPALLALCGQVGIQAETDAEPSEEANA